MQCAEQLVEIKKTTRDTLLLFWERWALATAPSHTSRPEDKERLKTLGWLQDPWKKRSRASTGPREVMERPPHQFRWLEMSRQSWFRAMGHFGGDPFSWLYMPKHPWSCLETKMVFISRLSQALWRMKVSSYRENFNSFSWWKRKTRERRIQEASSCTLSLLKYLLPLK